MDVEPKTTNEEEAPSTAPFADGSASRGDAWKRRALGLVVALVVGVCVRIWWLGAVDTQPVTDFDWYFERANGIVHGLGYSVDGVPTAYWPVGYPGALALVFRIFGVSVVVGKAFNTVLTLVAIALSWRIALALFRDHRVATGAALILAFHPAYIAYSGILASEPLYTCLALSGLAAIVAGWRGTRTGIVLAGVAFGLAVLVRPQAIVIPLIVLACARWKDARETYNGRTLKALALAYALILLVLVPWTWRNFAVFCQPVLVSTNGGDNLVIGNSPKADGRYENPSEMGFDLSGLGEVDRDHLATRLAVAYAIGHKRRTVSLWPVKLQGTFLSGTDAPYWAFQKTKGVMVSPGMGTDKAFYKGFGSYSVSFTAWLLGLAGFGAFVAVVARRSARLPVTGLALVAYSGLLSLVFFGNPRFAFPVVPFLAMHAVHGFVVVFDRYWPRTKQDGRQRNAVDRPFPPPQAPTVGSQNS